MRRVVYPSIQKPFSLNSADSCLSSPVSFHPSYTRNHTSSPSQRYSQFQTSSPFRLIGIARYTLVSPLNKHSEVLKSYSSRWPVQFVPICSIYSTHEARNFVITRHTTYSQ